MIQLGAPIVYSVPKDRHMPTLKHDKSEVIGSAYHPEQTAFAALVTRVYDNARKCDIVIFPPNRGPVTVNNVPADELADPSEHAFDAGDEDPKEAA